MDRRAKLTRRGFLLGAGAGLAVGAPLGWFGLKAWQDFGERRSRFSGRSAERAGAPLGMPGPFPGRVVEVRHAGAVSDAHVIDADAVKTMIDRGMCALTGADEPLSAWRRFFEPSDVVGIKVNPVGHPLHGRSDAVGSISSIPVLFEVVANLK